MSTTEYLLIHTVLHMPVFYRGGGGWRFHQEVFPFAILLFLSINNSSKSKGLYCMYISPHCYNFTCTCRLH